MTVELAAAIWTGIGLYLATGLAFALVYVFALVGGLDPAAKNMAVRVRLLLIPGVMLLWPLMLVKALFRKGPPVK